LKKLIEGRPKENFRTLKAKDRSLRQLLQVKSIHVGAAAGCDLLILSG